MVAHSSSFALEVYLPLAKNNALTYSGDIFKTGRVHVSLRPTSCIGLS
jgi:hypothetical protein